MAKGGDLADILEQMSRLMEAQANAQKALLEQLVKPKDTEFLMEALSKTLPEFSYDPQNGVVFDKWYARHQEVFSKGGAALEEADRVRLLLQKLNSMDHDRYVNFILPRTPREITFADTVETLKEMFGHQTSVFFRRFQCLQTRKRDADDFVTYASAVNKSCEDFNVNTITADQFKCLIFVAGLHSEKNKDIRTRLLAKMESETVADPMTLKKLLLESLSEPPPEVGGKKKKKYRNKKQHEQTGHTKGIYAVNKAGVIGRRKYVEICINDFPIELQIDCGSDYTIVSEESLTQLGDPETCSTSLKVTTASGKLLPLNSEFECQVTLKGLTKRSVCYVTSVKGFNVLGSDLMDAFGLYDVPINSFCKLVTTVGDSEVYCNALKVDFSNWAAPIVAVRKAQRDADGDPIVRICADYSTGLNVVLEANKFPLPTPDDIFAKLSGSQYFSVLDLSDAYLQMEVEEDSQKLLTVNTHKGLFKYKRLPPGAFQKVIDNMIGDLEGTESFLDDVIVFGKTRAKHDQNLENTIQRIQEYGFRLKIEKCKFCMSQVKYLGHIIDRDGIRTDPEKVSAISQMPPPRNVTELRSFLGAVNYYAKFIKEMHLLRKPFDQLLQKDRQWDWKEECKRSFLRFKELLKSDLVLTHYNPQLQIVVAADASNTGIGANIRHRFPDGTEKVIQHASRSLTPTERGYGQIDKEALALVYAVQYVSTTKFGYVDILSRLINSAVKPEEDFVIASVQLEEDLLAVLEDSVGNTPVTSRMIATATKHDKVLKRVAVYRVRLASKAKSPAHATPEAWPTPSGPWQRLHIDFAGPIDGLWFLIIVDAFSRWPEIYPTKTTTAKVTKQFLRSTFARLGLPLTIVSDNAAQFTCEEFETYCKLNGITHLLTTPYHPQSNGQAERFVDSMKRAMKKINKGEPLQETLEVFLATYRSTPSGVTEQKSPSEMMFGRQMRTTLDLLRPTEISKPVDLETAQQPRQFNTGDLVYAKVHKRNDWYWEVGKMFRRISHLKFNQINRMGIQDNDHLFQRQVKSQHFEGCLEIGFLWLPLLEDDRFAFLQDLSTTLCPKEGDAIAPPYGKQHWC
ncbi:uncharacterized protein K02A2.6-like [Ochlerotatus camptorhynchus]|uniref:uncharacterized protein K02A2.6-like n=1 Tax=Ochlerotatus camptorhynchus TaxID=644619 RepID=UPI0031E37B47